MTDYPQATATVQVDNDRVRVTEWHFKPGQATGYHRHEWAYVVTPTSGGRLKMTGPDGEKEAVLVTSQAYYRDAGVEHNVINIDDHDVVFVETELKT